MAPQLMAHCIHYTPCLDACSIFALSHAIYISFHCTYGQCANVDDSLWHWLQIEHHPSLNMSINNFFAGFQQVPRALTILSGL